MPSSSPVKIFAGSRNQILGEKIAHAYGQPLGKISIQVFSDGEISPSFEESVRGCDIFIVQSTFSPSDNLMELLLMIDAARRSSAQQISVVVPYYGYARQDKKDRPRVAIGAKLVANLLSAAGVNRLITLDLHSGAIQGFFDFPVDHLEGTSVFVPYVRSLDLENLVIASPDVGGVIRARHFARYFNAEMVICDKQRKKANEISAMQLIGDVKDANVILVDDLIDTGGTLCKASDLLLSKGAKTVRAIATHAIMSGNAYEKIIHSSLTEIVVSDSVPLKENIDKISVLSVADLFSNAIKTIHQHRSIGALFIQP